MALVDLELPDISGVEVIKAVLKKGCGTELLVLSCWEDDGHLFSALRAGAGGYIVKNEASRVVKAIEEVVNGGAPMSMGIARRVLSELKEILRKDKRPELQVLARLTKREEEVLQHRAKGFDTKKVATMLDISYEAVRVHQKNIYRKLQVNTILEAMLLYMEMKSS